MANELLMDLARRAGQGFSLVDSHGTSTDMLSLLRQYDAVQGTDTAAVAERTRLKNLMLSTADTVDHTGATIWTQLEWLIFGLSP